MKKHTKYTEINTN